MSTADRIEQQRIADLFQVTRQPEPIKPPRSKRLKDLAEGYGVGWFLAQIMRSIR